MYSIGLLSSQRTHMAAVAIATSLVPSSTGVASLPAVQRQSANFSKVPRMVRSAASDAASFQPSLPAGIGKVSFCLGFCISVWLSLMSCFSCCSGLAANARRAPCDIIAKLFESVCDLVGNVRTQQPPCLEVRERLVETVGGFDNCACALHRIMRRCLCVGEAAVVALELEAIQLPATN